MLYTVYLYITHQQNINNFFLKLYNVKITKFIRKMTSIMLQKGTCKQKRIVQNIQFIDTPKEIGIKQMYRCYAGLQAKAGFVFYGFRKRTANTSYSNNVSYLPFNSQLNFLLTLNIKHK